MFLFTKVMEFVKKMAGQEYVGFSNGTWVLCQMHSRYFTLIYLCWEQLSEKTAWGKLPVRCPVALLMFQYWPILPLCLRFQSEKETGDRNFAIGYYMKEKKVSDRMLKYVGLEIVYFLSHLFEIKLQRVLVQLFCVCMYVFVTCLFLKSWNI